MTDSGQPADATETANPLARNGKVSYLEIPATDVPRSAAFYEGLFGWTITHRHADGQRASFEDGSGQLIGAFVAGRAVSREPGVLPYIYVTAIRDTAAAVTNAGCELVRPIYQEGDLWVTEFHDPAGNVMGIWQFQ